MWYGRSQGFGATGPAFQRTVSMLSMSYNMHRIFCAAAGDLERERAAFYDVMGDFNAAHAMPRNVLFIAVALPDRTYDKRPFQAAVSENIRSCRYYIQVVEDTWGPPEKNFERDHAVACQCVADPGLPMQEIAVLFKKPLMPHQVEPGILDLKRKLEADRDQLHAEFDSIEEYRRQLHGLLSRWLETVAPASVGRSGAA
jgi:hypothetical protein